MLPSGLSMLWESSVQPDVALRERFGFDGFDEAGRWISASLEQTWAITAKACTRLVISDANAIAWVSSSRGPLVVKWSRAVQRFELLDASTRLLAPLAERGVPVAAPVPTIDGRARAVLEGPAGALSLALLPELAGDWLDVRDLGAVHSAGACLARMHEALASCIAGEAFQPLVFTDLAERVDAWLTHQDRGYAPEASERLKGLLASAPSLDDRPQLVHNDFRAANILMAGTAVVGVLDLDEVRVGHRVHDLARASVYLATRFTNWRPTSVATRQALWAGYESVRRLGPAEARWLEVLVVFEGLQAISGPEQTGGWATAV